MAMEFELGIENLLQVCRYGTSATDFVIHAPNEFVGYLLSCYPEKLAASAKALTRQQATVDWPGCPCAYEIPVEFAEEQPCVAAVASNGSSEPESSSQEAIATPSTQPQLALPQPRDRDQEILYRAITNEKPTGIMSLASGQVLFMNLLMPEFTGRPLDQIAVPNTYDLFRKRDEYQPDDPVAFNERLIKEKIINGSLKAFRTSGAFGSFHGVFRYEILKGIPVRISEYDNFELIV